MIVGATTAKLHEPKHAHTWETNNLESDECRERNEMYVSVMVSRLGSIYGFIGRHNAGNLELEHNKKKQPK